MSVPALCAFPKELKPLAEGCKVTKVPEDMGCDHGRKWVRIADPGLDTWVPFMHHDCQHNQVIALHNRVLGAVPRPTPEGVASLRKQAKAIGSLLPKVAPRGWYAMPNSYKGSKRDKYIQAVERVLAGGLHRKDAGVKMFVKGEKLNPKKNNPDPRAIQFRDPKYCVALARYLKPLEHHLYELCGDGKILPESRLIGKGLSQYGRATLLQSKLSNFKMPRVLSLDASRFDQHVDIELLKVEHSVYNTMCYHPEFKRLLQWQLINYGTSSKGIKYVAKGKRMSGDLNTALGNCLLMVIMVSAFMRGLPGDHKYDLLDDGDDCLLIIEADSYEVVAANIQPTFLTYGMELKIESVADTLEKVEWCQGNPVQIGAGVVKFVRNPWKLMSVALGGTKYFDAPERPRRRLVNTIGTSELILNLGVPVLQEFAVALMRNAETTELIRYTEADGYYHKLDRELKELNIGVLSRYAPPPITDVARESFFVAFGITPQEQLDLEEALSRWQFNLVGDTPIESDYTVPDWINRNPYSCEKYHLRE